MKRLSASRQCLAGCSRPQLLSSFPVVKADSGRDAIIDAQFSHDGDCVLLRLARLYFHFSAFQGVGEWTGPGVETWAKFEANDLPPPAAEQFVQQQAGEDLPEREEPTGTTLAGDEAASAPGDETVSRKLGRSRGDRHAVPLHSSTPSTLLADSVFRFRSAKDVLSDPRWASLLLDPAPAPVDDRLLHPPPPDPYIGLAHEFSAEGAPVSAAAEALHLRRWFHLVYEMLKLIAACDLSDQELFSLTRFSGPSFLWQLSSFNPIVREMLTGSAEDRVERAMQQAEHLPKLLDLGAAGGIDTNWALLNNFRVLAVESARKPMELLQARLFRPYFPRMLTTRMLHLLPNEDEMFRRRNVATAWMAGTDWEDREGGRVGRCASCIFVGSSCHRYVVHLSSCSGGGTGREVGHYFVRSFSVYLLRSTRF